MRQRSLVHDLDNLPLPRRLAKFIPGSGLPIPGFPSPPRPMHNAAHDSPPFYHAFHERVKQFMKGRLRCFSSHGVFLHYFSTLVLPLPHTFPLLLLATLPLCHPFCRFCLYSGSTEYLGIIVLLQNVGRQQCSQQSTEPLWPRKVRGQHRPLKMGNRGPQKAG